MSGRGIVVFHLFRVRLPASRLLVALCSRELMSALTRLAVSQSVVSAVALLCTSYEESEVDVDV